MVAGPYWSQSSEALIAALVLAVAQGRPPGGGAVPKRERPWVWPVPAERHLASVYAALLAGGPGGGRLDDWIEQFPPDHPAYKAYGPVRLSVEKTRSSILGTGATAMRLFGDQAMAWLTGAQDHDLADLGRRPTAVFLVIPDERSTRYPLATLYVQQTLQALAALADEHGGRLPVRVNFLLDEFGNLPQIKGFEQTAAVARGRGIRLVIVLQDLSQLQAVYGPAGQAIQGAMRLWAVLGIANEQSAATMARMLGGRTVAAENRSIPDAPGFFSADLGRPASTTQALTRRELLTADELLRWPEGQMLLLRVGDRPARLPLPDLSAWECWPEIQTPGEDPPRQPIHLPPVWRIPDPGRKPASADATPPSEIGGGRDRVGKLRDRRDGGSPRPL